MLRRNLWKLILACVIVTWAVSELFPLKNIDFAVYARSHVTAKAAEFDKLLDEAAARKTERKESDYTALREIAHERHIDLSQYFPNIRLESTLTNVNKRNQVLLAELQRRSRAGLQLGLDLNGGVAVTLQVNEKAAAKESDALRQENLGKAVDLLGERINSLGVAEPLIRPVGNNRIEVQLPGLDTKTNPDVIDEVKKPARLDFRLVHPTLSPETTSAADTPPGYEALTMDVDNGRGQSSTQELFVKRIPEMTGKAISNAFARPDAFGKWEVILQLTKEGQKTFTQVTRDLAAAGQRTGAPARLAIVLDGKLIEAPTVQNEIDGDSAQITGDFTERDASTLATDLNNPLDLPLFVQAQVEVGPSLAQDAIDSGVRAAVIGAVLVAAFMITYYRIGGVIAIITLGVNVLVILGVMASIHATMTLPGLAGIVLTIGMAVDANILVFERMREELKLGKSLRTALAAGYDKAFMTIIDAHVTQLAICAIMIWLGTGPIKGFGVTLAIGVFSTMFSVLVVAHLIMEWMVEKEVVKKFPMMHLLDTHNFDFVKYGKPSVITSWLIVLLGLCVVFYKGSRIYGIDFAGGDTITMSFRQPIGVAQIRQVAEANKIGDVAPSIVTPVGGGAESLRVETPPDRSGELFAALQKAYPQAGLEKIGVNHTGPAIGKETEWNAFESIGWSMVVILLYVAFRFEFGFGIGAVVASVHDILMTIGIFVLSGRQFSAPMVAAILSIAGYSINDTIVVFDRIREELRLNPGMKLRDVVNLAINRVFSRSIMTSVTTFLAALALFVFGTGVMNDLSFTFIVGIITGTFSSIFIATPIFYWWHRGERRHVEAHADVAPKYEWQGSSKASH